jgi:hypothetical protein
MNPQPDPIIGNIIALLFVLTTIFYAVKAIFENQTFQLSDNFVIGYIETDPIIINEVHNDHETHSAKTKQSIDWQSQQLYTDCINALVALGMKKKDAKNKTILVFSTSNPQPKTIQEFLMIALKLP